ncbi:MAG: hypothetical protein ACRDDZ_11980 [Marinifilaceae bacterium]
MFDVVNDRINLSNWLKIGNKEELVFAFCTTFSLDLKLLSSLLMTMGMGEELDSYMTESDMFLLSAFEKAKDKVIVFYNEGSIKVPDQKRKLYSLLDEVAYGIKIKGRAYFHPKVWIVWTQRLDKHIIKICIGTRNLTKSQNMEMAFTLSGSKGKNINDSNLPLSQLIHFCRENSSLPNDAKKHDKLRELEDLIMYIDWENTNSDFEDFEFRNFGINKKDNIEDHFINNANELFVITPFYTPSFVQAITKDISKTVIITRQHAITPVLLKAFQEVYTMKDIPIGNNEFYDVHAKLYYYKATDVPYLALGSCNFTQNAFTVNIEFMIILKFSDRDMDIEKFKTLFIYPSKDGFTPCLFQQFANGAEIDLEIDETNDYGIDKRVIDAIVKATVIPEGNMYRIEISVNKLPDGDYQIAPLQRSDKKTQLISPVTIINGISMRDISQFYTLTSNSLSTCMRIQTEGIPHMRNGTIVNTLIRTEEDLFNYLTTLLSSNYLKTFLTENIAKGPRTPGQSSVWKKTSTHTDKYYIYEDLLIAASRKPGKIEEINYLLNSLNGETFIPKPLREMVEMFLSIVKKQSKR